MADYGEKEYWQKEFNEEWEFIVESMRIPVQEMERILIENVAPLKAFVACSRKLESWDTRRITELAFCEKRFAAFDKFSGIPEIELPPLEDTTLSFPEFKQLWGQWYSALNRAMKFEETKVLYGFFIDMGGAGPFLILGINEPSKKIYIAQVGEKSEGRDKFESALPINACRFGIFYENGFNSCCWTPQDAPKAMRRSYRKHGKTLKRVLGLTRKYEFGKY